MNNGFVFACNSTFYSGLLITVKSLLKYNPTAKIEVLDTGLDQEQVNELESHDIRVIDIKEKLKAHFHNKRDWHSDFSVYGSLFIDESSFDNIIFCDSDLLILSDMSQYFKCIEKYKVVATKENSINCYFNPRFSYPLRRYVTKKGQQELDNMYLEINWDYTTFNSGFWGIQKSYYKELKDKYWHLLMSLETEFTYHDQTFINLALCLDNQCYYDAGFGYNAVNIGTVNMYKTAKRYVKYLWYKLTNNSYVINGENVSYKKTPIKVLHWTGGDKPFLKNKDKLFGGGYFSLEKIYVIKYINHCA